MAKSVATKKTIKNNKKDIVTKSKQVVKGKVTKSVPKKAEKKVKTTSAKAVKKITKPIKQVKKIKDVKGSKVKEKSKTKSTDKNVKLKDRFDKKIEKLSYKEKKEVKTPEIVEKEAVVKETSAQKPNNDSTLSYTQLEFYDNVKAFCGFDKRNQAKEVCDDITNFILDALAKGYKVPFLGLGKLYVRTTKARIVRDLATGETVHIKAKNRVRFAPAKSLFDF